LPNDLSEAAQEVRDGCLAFRVRRLNRRVTRIYNAALRPHGLTIAQFTMLVALSMGRDFRAGDLARVLDLEKSTVSRNLKRLVEHRWAISEGVERVLRLTATGRRLVSRAMPAWREAQREAAAAIDADLVQAIRSVGR
jgi:DNA-binding MarR family transcriptional regulator